MEIIRKSDPKTMDDISRGFIPIEVREGDVSGIEAMTLGLPCGFSGRFRVLVVYAHSLADVDKFVHVAKLLGPATGDPNLSIPCEKANDWAWVQDYMESRHETLERRAIDRALRMRGLQDQINRQLPDIADNMTKQKVGKSTFGYGGHMQRTA